MVWWNEIFAYFNKNLSMDDFQGDFQGDVNLIDSTIDVVLDQSKRKHAKVAKTNKQTKRKGRNNPQRATRKKSINSVSSYAWIPKHRGLTSSRVKPLYSSSLR